MRLLLAHMCFYLSACACFAGSVETSVPTSLGFAIPDDEAEWGGFYAGGLGSFDSGELNYGSTAGQFDLNSSTLGAFAGYNFQSGDLIYGAEAAYVFGATPAMGDAEYSSFFDVKARAGYSVGDALVYGVVGGSVGVWEDRTGPPETVSTAGMNYGLGVDYQVTDTIFVGAEYLVRDLVGELETPGDISIDSLFQSAQIRVGLRF